MTIARTVRTVRSSAFSMDCTTMAVYHSNCLGNSGVQGRSRQAVVPISPRASSLEDLQLVNIYRYQGSQHCFIHLYWD